MGYHRNICISRDIDTTQTTENYATFAQSWTVILLSALFWCNLSSLAKVKVCLYGFPTMWLAYIHRSVRLLVQDIGIAGQFELDNPINWQIWHNKPQFFLWNNTTYLSSTYIRVCVISANLAQNRVELIHDVDLSMRLYGSMTTDILVGRSNIHQLMHYHSPLLIDAIHS